MTESLSYLESMEQFPEAPERNFSVDEQMLREHFKGRHFEFTSNGIVDSIPTWCTGVVDGKRFYFRFRGDTARLIVGFFEISKVFADHRAAINAKMDAVKENFEKDPVEMDSIEMFERLESLQKITGRLIRAIGHVDMRIPNSQIETAFRSEVTGEEYASSFAKDGELATLFIELFESLKPLSD